MKVCTLFSGSRGNATYATDGFNHILIDCGMGYRSTVKQLEKISVEPKDITAIFITHTHCDHINGIHNFVKYNPNVKIFVHEDSAQEFYLKTSWDPMTFRTGFEYMDMGIEFCPLYHDVSCCIGYSLDDGKGKLCYITDTGVFDDKMTEFCKDAKTLVIESNHDVTMLNCGPYPYMLKKRILSVEGHLSNAQTADALKKILPNGVSNVILAHLSENNNTPELALFSARHASEEIGSAAKIIAASQWDISGLI